METAVVLFGAVVYAIACRQLPFSADQTALIGTLNDGAMTTLLVENPDDSLALHTHSRRLQRHQSTSPEIDILKARMMLTVTDTLSSGVGLAAPQVGIPYKLIVVRRLDTEGEPWRFYLNPEITRYSDEKAMGREGCFSVATRRGVVERSTSIDIRYNDPETFKVCTEHIEGFTAVIFQHEIDHLEGVLFTDRAAEILPNN